MRCTYVRTIAKMNAEIKQILLMDCGVFKRIFLVNLAGI